MRLLLVEDNPEIGAAICARFSEERHAVDWARSLADAHAFSDSSSYDLVILDLMLPDGSGRDFLRHLRAREVFFPVLVLSAMSQVADRISVLDLGADDYLIKPFDFAELEARCRAILRRNRGTAVEKVTFGDVVFDPANATLNVASQAFRLRARENRLLEVFMAAPEKILAKHYLIDRLFSLNEEATENAIEVYVARLRKKLAGSQAEIETVRGSGYRLQVRQ